MEAWEAQEGECVYIYIHIDDSLCCTAETNTALKSHYPPIKSFLRSIDRN